MREVFKQSLLAPLLLICALAAIGSGARQNVAEKPPQAVAFPDDLKRDCEAISTQVTLLIERRDRLVLQAQINAGLGKDYQIDYAGMQWRKKADPPKETKP